MKKKLPVLIIIPHGGLLVPEELAAHTPINAFDLMFNADACANELFSVAGAEGIVRTDISRLFIDVDRPAYELPPAHADGVMKTRGVDGKPLFNASIFPDEIAINNMLRRYYVPFHEAIERTATRGEVRLIIECHTMMPVGPRNASDEGRPRPIITVNNRTRVDEEHVTTCPDPLAGLLVDALKREFSDEEGTVAQRASLNRPSFDGYIMQRYGTGGIPLLRLSISRSLFFNERYFNYDLVQVDGLRVGALKKKIENGISALVKKLL